MLDWLVILYILNTSLLTAHEIDSAYWKEWKLFAREWKIFRLSPMGAQSFVLLHVAGVALTLWTVVALLPKPSWQPILNLGSALIGLGVCAIHFYLIKRGHPEFKTPVSMGVLIALTLVSIVQLVLVVPGLMASVLG